MEQKEQISEKTAREMIKLLFDNITASESLLERRYEELKEAGYIKRSEVEEFRYLIESESNEWKSVAGEHYYDVRDTAIAAIAELEQRIKELEAGK